MAPPRGQIERTAMKNIRRKPFDMKALRLSPEEGFVLSRLDSPLSIKELVDLTGIDEGRMATIVEGLATNGAVDVDREGPGSPGPVAPSSPPEEQPTDAERLDESAAELAREAEASAAEADEADDPEAEARREAGGREYQKIYETVWKVMTRDARIAQGLTADGAELVALCLDPEPQVISSVLTNPKSSLEHARMIAQHHRTHAGLEQVARRTEFVSDAHVQRRLLTNPQLPDTVLRKILSPKLLSDVYKIAVNREIPERSRVLTRELLQKKFMLASSDERAALLVRTEGRCLVLLINCALDARTTQMLTSKTSYTVLFIQNLARWSATPPAILTHLLKQPLVRQNLGLKKQLLKHRNMPSDAKRLA
jgi:hypothetical protein